MKKNSAGLIWSILFIAFIAGGCATTGNGGAGGSGGPVSGDPSVAAVLTGLTITEDAVEIKASGPFTYTVYKASDPYRVTVELPDVNIGSFKDKVMSDKGSISEVMPSQPQTEAPKLTAKLEILLKAPSEIEPLYKDNVLTLKTTGKARPSETATEAPKAVPAPVNPEAPAPAVTEKAAAEDTAKAGTPKKEEPLKEEPKKEELKKEEAQPLKKATELIDLSLESSEGSSRFVIKGNGYLKPEVFTLKNRIVIDLPGAALKAKIPSGVTPPVKSVRAGKHKDKTRLVIDLTEARAFEALSAGDSVTITLLGPGVPAPAAKKETNKENNKALKTQAKDKKGEKVLQPLDKAPDTIEAKESAVESAKPAEKESAVESKKAPEPATPPAAIRPAKAHEAAHVAAPDAPAMPSEAKEKGTETLPESKFTGTKISLDFQDADIIPIFRLLTDISGFNIVVNPEVKGKLTMKLINVPWDQALDLILKTFSLDKRVDGNIIRIAPMTAFEKEDKDKTAAKKAEQEAEPLETRVLPISYADVSVVETTIKGSKILTSRGSLSVDKRTSSMVIKDVVSVFPQVEQLLATLDKPTPQVMIEARIVEVSSSEASDLGIQWGFSLNAKDTLSSFSGYPTLGTGSSTGSNYLVDFPGSAGKGAGSGFSFGILNPAKTFGLDLQLSALEKMGKGRIVSTPRILTTDNTEAMISQGTSEPYPQIDSTSGKVTTAFKDVAIVTKVTPHITPSGSINMVLAVTKEDILGWTDISGSKVPRTTKSEGHTTTLVQDGETIVIGGVFKTIESNTTAGVPLLKNIPLLGELFKSRSKTIDTSELLIFITPRISAQK